MRLGDIYVRKDNINDIIMINSFGTHVSFGTKSLEEMSPLIIIFNHIEDDDGHYGYCPSFNGYGSEKEIEEYYDFVMSSYDYKKCESYDQIIQKAKKIIGGKK